MERRFIALNIHNISDTLQYTVIIFHNHWHGKITGITP